MCIEDIVLRVGGGAQEASMDVPRHAWHSAVTACLPPCPFSLFPFPLFLPAAPITILSSFRLLLSSLPYLCPSYPAPTATTIDNHDGQCDTFRFPSLRHKNNDGNYDTSFA